LKGVRHGRGHGPLAAARFEVIDRAGQRTLVRERRVNCRR
jgi:hypothetical protein